jgi:hypothetical protein
VIAFFSMVRTKRKPLKTSHGPQAGRPMGHPMSDLEGYVFGFPCHCLCFRGC